MTTQRLFLLGAFSAVLGGALLTLDVALHLFVDDTLEPSTLGGLAHEVWHIPGIVALPLAVLGLVAVYLGQAGQTGHLGLWGFVLLVIGMTVGAMYSTIFHGIFMPAVEATDPGLFEALVSEPTAAQFYRGLVVQALGLGLGAILFAVATIRAKVYPAITGWLFIAAALFAAANQVFPAGQLVSRALFGIAFVWYGLALRSVRSGEPATA